jgi:transcriptional regulator with GAF, ATPase, and Fis domain
MITTLLSIFQSLMNSYEFLFFILSFAFGLKALNLFILARREAQKTAQLPWVFLLVLLASNMIIDFVWIVKLIQIIFAPSINIAPLFFIRIAWGMWAIQYLALAFFLESLVKKKLILKLRHKIMILIGLIFVLFFIGLAIISSKERPQIEFHMLSLVCFFNLFILLPVSFVVALRKIKNELVPRILIKQLKLLMLVCIVPIWITDAMQALPFNYSPNLITNSYTAVGFSALLVAALIFYCTRRIIGLRFLNMQTHVASHARLNFTNNFKALLERFTSVTNMQELGHISQSFFKESFEVPLNKTRLYIRSTEFTGISHDQLRSLTETFLSTHEKTICDIMQTAKILIHDEIAFNNFYEETKETAALLRFLETINADIFLPIYEKDKLIGYIIIDRYARNNNEFYSDAERDEMLIFANYLANIINLIQHRNLDELVHQEKLLREELYRKHQEATQCRESIRSFIRTSKQKAIGIVFYKNRRFTLANQEAQELIKINPNTQEGHPLAKSLKAIATQVEQYKAPLSASTKDAQGNTLILSAVPSLEYNNVIITISYPEISDILKKQIDDLQDPSEWDYLLYLETTKTGQLINQLIPGSGQTLLNFKIDLLKIALSKKAILLDMPEEDLQPTVELLHHISLRTTLHILTLNSQAQNFDTAIKLFGINPIFGYENSNTPPLLEKLDEIGTLCIQNVHFLDLESQEYLAEFIHYGFFRKFKSEQKIASNVRIITTTNENLSRLVQDGKFSKELFNELKHTSLSLPSLLTLDEDEVRSLAQGFSEQAITTDALKNLLELTDRDKTKLVNKRPTSLQELKTKVQQLLILKSKKNDISHDTQFDPAYQVSDPELIEAARLGKHALKDRKTMINLWHKFKSQNKIATFLGVNRSSVNRRCKEYNLQE